MNELVHTSVRLPGGLLAWLIGQAKRERRSVSQLIVRCCETIRERNQDSNDGAVLPVRSEGIVPDEAGQASSR